MIVSTGCLGASGLGVTGTDPVSPSTSNATIVEETATTADPPPSSPSGSSSGGNDVSADAGREPAGETTASSETTETEARPGTTTDWTSASSSSSASGASSAGPAPDTTTGSWTTTEGTATETSDAPVPEGPQRGEVVSDASIQVPSHDSKDCPDGQASVGGSLQNPTDRRLDLVTATVVLYDESGAEVGRQFTTKVDLAPGDPATYVASFEDVDYLDVDRYRIEATVAEAPVGTPAGTSTTPTATPTATPAETQSKGTTPSVSTPPPTTEAPLPPPDLVRDCAQPVVDDPPAKVVDCQLEDCPQPKAVVEVEVGDAGDEPIDRVRVTRLLFDRDGNEVERDVRSVEAPPGGERYGYLYETQTDYDELSNRYEVVVQAVG
mgnify:CR=1 FL=1